MEILRSKVLELTAQRMERKVALKSSSQLQYKANILNTIRMIAILDASGECFHFESLLASES